MKKRKLAVMLTAVVMAIAMIPSTVFASGGWGEDYDSKEEFTINSVDELKTFAEMVNNGKSFSGKKVTLNEDINLEGESWIPIGTSENAFAGTFNGNENKISNLTINDDDLEYAGLFGVLKTPGIIKNLTIENADITAKAQVGALAGSAYTGTVEGCHITGNINITGNYKVGGLAGEGYARVEDCSVIGNEGSYIHGIYSAADYEGDNVGGLIGYRGEGSTATSGCSVSGVSIEGTRKVGGLLGTVYNNNITTDCSVSDIAVSSNATREYAEQNATKMGVGGLFGSISTNGNVVGQAVDCKVSGVTLGCSDDIKDLVRIGYVSGGLYGIEEFTGPSEEQMVVDVEISGANSMPEGVLQPQSGSDDAIGIDAVAQVGNQSFKSLEEAVKAAMEGDDKTVTILKDMTVATWNQIWNIKGITIDGSGKAITVTKAIDSLGNNDAVLHSAGGNTFKNITFDLSGIEKSNAQGNRAINAAAGDTIDNVTVIGGEHLNYGITCSGTDAADETITISDCTFEDCGYGVYDSEGGSVENVVITGSAFTGCDYATILRGESSRFTDNTIDNGKLNIMKPNQTITGNTFTGESRIKFYDAGATFKQNNIGPDSYLDFDDDVTGTVDVSKNYWGGGAPSEEQLGGADSAGNVTGTDVYYMKATMAEEDLNTYVPPATEPGGEGSSSATDKPAADNVAATGDDSNMMIPVAMAAIALVSMVVIAAARKKQNR